MGCVVSTAIGMASEAFADAYRDTVNNQRRMERHQNVMNSGRQRLTGIPIRSTTGHSSEVMKIHVEEGICILRGNLRVTILFCMMIMQSEKHVTY